MRLIKPHLQSNAASRTWQQLYACRASTFEQTDGRSTDELGAWQLVAIWVLAIATGKLTKKASLLEAEAWFLGRYGPCGLAKLISAEAREATEVCLRKAAEQKVYAELLPYILDPHGQGSRLSVRRRPKTAAARQQKRDEGVFYTPRDVADFMVKQILDSLEIGTIPRTVFDPACGTGVFLRSVLAGLHSRTPVIDVFDLACSSIYGTDIDSWALNASAFLLLHDCDSAVASRGIAPVSAWHALRLNLAQQDALRLDTGRYLPLDDQRRLARLDCRAILKAGGLPEAGSVKNREDDFVAFDALFPEIAPGPRIVLGNPPYADVGNNTPLLAMAYRFETLRVAPRPASDMFPLFFEQMIRLAAPDAHGGTMVLPVSVGCNTGRQFTALRALIAKTPGHWRFAFFDREPHALFGEDVKTRNAIVVWTRDSNEQDVRISSGPLRKWRAGARERMFETITFTPIQADIRRGVPKVDGAEQAAAFEHLLRVSRTLQHLVAGMGRATLKEALAGNDRTVYVGATAYNFLNVFLTPPRWDNEGIALTEHPLHALHCASHADALRVFALLNSRLAFWWWHANGDGFHVSRGMLEAMPIGTLLDLPEFEGRLADMGESLWRKVRASPIVSLNRSRNSLAYSASAYEEERTAIDTLFVKGLGLAPEFVKALERFLQNVIKAETSPHVDNNERNTGT